MSGYKDFIRAGLGHLTEDKTDMVKGLFANEQETESSVSKLEQETQQLEEREEMAYFQSRLFQLVGRNWSDYTEQLGRRVGHPKPSCQKAKEVSKRRKKNKNKKTHRKR